MKNHLSITAMYLTAQTQDIYSRPSADEPSTFTHALPRAPLPYLYPPFSPRRRPFEEKPTPPLRQRVPPLIYNKNARPSAASAATPTCALTYDAPAVAGEVLDAFGALPVGELLFEEPDFAGAEALAAGALLAV